jgi:hypothetical protein
MSDNKDTLDQIAQEIGEVVDEQDPEAGQDDPAREGDEFDLDEYMRNKDDYDGDW